MFARILGAPIEAASAKRALGVWIGAALIVVSFAFEAWGWVRLGNGIRFAALAIWALLAIPALLRKSPAPSTRAWALRMGIGSVALSFLIRAFWPGPGYAIAHILFLGGFGLAILIIADRVSLGHADVLESVPAKSKLWRWIVWLTLLTAATRASADMKASLLVSHQIYAALMWAIIIGLWAWTHCRHWWGDRT